MGELTLPLVMACVREVLNHKHATIERITLDGNTTLESLHFDSLDIALLFSALEASAQADIDPDSVQVITTIADLTRLQSLGPIGNDSPRRASPLSGGDR